MEISMKDLKTLLRHMEATIYADKRTLERNQDNDRNINRYLDYIEKRVVELEPIVNNINNQLNNIKIQINK